MNLTDRQRSALNDAIKQPLQRRPPDRTWPANPSTLHSLTRRELVTYSKRRTRAGHLLEEWAITQTGRDALEPRLVIKRDRPLYLAHCGHIRYRQLPNGRWAVNTSGDGNADYTSDPRQSIDRDYSPNSRTPIAVETLHRDDTALIRYAEDARRRADDLRRDHGRALDAKTLDARLDELGVIARRHHMDFTAEARLVRHMLAAGRTNDAVKRLEQAEIQLRQRAA